MLALVRTGRPFALAALALVVTALAPQTSTATQAANRHEFCANRAGLYASEFSIEACTRLIVAGNKTPKDLAVIFGYRCKQYLEEKQFDRALQDCNEALWLDNKSLSTYQTRGLVHEQTHRPKRAAADFMQVISQQPSSAGAWQGLCRNELALDQLQLTISACSEALQLQPGDASTLVSRALAYLKAGAFDQAIADFDIALRAKPAHAMALYGRGIARLNRHDGNNGAADIAAAKSIQADIAKQCADRYGVKPSRGLMVSTSPDFEY